MLPMEMMLLVFMLIHCVWRQLTTMKRADLLTPVAREVFGKDVLTSSHLIIVFSYFHRFLFLLVPFHFLR